MYNCQTCGACCSNPDPKWIEVTEDEAEQIPQEFLQPGDIEPYSMYMKGNRCCCLRGVVGESTYCYIYNKSPGVCKRVQPGDEICELSRNLHGIKDNE